MEDSLDAVSEGELVDDLLLRVLEVHLPRVLAVGLGQLDHALVIFAQIVEQVLMQTRVLHVIGGNLGGEKQVSFQCCEASNGSNIEAFIAQGLEHWSCKPGVESSNLSEGKDVFSCSKYSTAVS